MRVMSLAGILRALLIVIAIGAALPALAQQPQLTGRVVDSAGIIDAATEEDLTAKLEAFEKKSSDQIVVATVPNLGGETIEPYANRMFRAWGLGQAGENNGILLLVALEDRKVRIEVGYGLEGTLTDLHSKLIIENTMVPAFRAGDYSGGISRAVDDIIMVLEGNGAELEARAERNRQSDRAIDIDTWIVIIFFTIWFSIFFGSIGISLLAPIFGRKIGPRRYRWLGMDVDLNRKPRRRRSSSGWVNHTGGSGWSGGGGGWSGGGGFSGGGGSSGGGGASGSW